MKSFVFPIVVEPDEDKWSSYVPGLVDKGAATWGETQQEALKNIQEVTELVIESLIAHGEEIPDVVHQTPLLEIS